jgi:hypothetical protein
LCWRTQTLAWLREKCGIEIRVVLEHSDEAYMNLH